MAKRTPAGAASAESLTQTVASLMPELQSDLARLVAIPSVSAAGFPDSTHPPLLEAYEEIVELCRRAGAQNIAPLEALPTSSCPSITSLIPTGGCPPHARNAPIWASTFDFESELPRP